MMKLTLWWFTTGALEAVKQKPIIVVIDALRATSFIVTALALGAKYIIPVSTVKEALDIKRKHPEVLLAGEVEGSRIPGFDLGPSPLELYKVDVKNKIIIHRSTSGVQVLCTLKGYDEVYVGSFLNAKAVANYVYERAKRLGKDIAIILAGYRRTHFALDDFLCAGTIANHLPLNDAELPDSILAAKYLYKAYKDKILDIVRVSLSSRHISKLGYSKDVEYCSQVNKYNVIPSLTKIDNGIYAIVDVMRDRGNS